MAVRVMAVCGLKNSGKTTLISALVRELSSLAPTLSEGERVRLSFPIGDTQTLLVEAERRGESYKILRWQSVYTGSWETNDRIDVWSGK